MICVGLGNEGLDLLLGIPNEQITQILRRYVTRLIAVHSIERFSNALFFYTTFNFECGSKELFLKASKLNSKFSSRLEIHTRWLTCVHNVTDCIYFNAAENLFELLITVVALL